MQTTDILRLGVHVLQSIIAVAIVGCSAVELSYYSSSPYGLAIFTAIATILVAAFIATASFCARFAYKLWVFIAVNVFTGIFWVATIATMAHHHAGGCGGYKHDYCYRKRYVEHKNSLWAVNIALSVIDCVLSLLLIGLAFRLRK